MKTLIASISLLTLAANYSFASDGAHKQYLCSGSNLHFSLNLESDGSATGLGLSGGYFSNGDRAIYVYLNGEPFKDINKEQHLQLNLTFDGSEDFAEGSFNFHDGLRGQSQGNLSCVRNELVS